MGYNTHRVFVGHQSCNLTSSELTIRLTRQLRTQTENKASETTWLLEHQLEAKTCHYRKFKTCTSSCSADKVDEELLVRDVAWLTAKIFISCCIFPVSLSRDVLSSSIWTYWAWEETQQNKTWISSLLSLSLSSSLPFYIPPTLPFSLLSSLFPPSLPPSLPLPPPFHPPQSQPSQCSVHTEVVWERACSSRASGGPEGTRDPYTECSWGRFSDTPVWGTVIQPLDAVIRLKYDRLSKTAQYVHSVFHM